jgi:hypothetical protein
LLPFTVLPPRELFSDFFSSLFGYPLPQLLADSPAPAAAQLLYSQMMRDILGGGGHDDPLAQVAARRMRFLACLRMLVGLKIAPDSR